MTSLRAVMWKRCLPIVGLLAACTLLASAPSVADDALGTLAIVSVNQPSQALGDLLSAELSGAAGIELVERDRIQAALGELSLTAAGLVAPDQRARLGAILAADVVLFVEVAAKIDPPQFHLAAVETRTGLQLLDLLLPAAQMEKASAAAAAATRGALQRSKTADESRLYVAFTGVRSEEPGEYLLPNTQALTALVRHDLQRTPRVFLLERARLRQLTAEQELTGIDLALKSAALLVDGGLRRNVTGEGFNVTVRVSSLDREQARTTQVEVASNDISVVRRQAYAELMGLLGAAAIDAEPVSRQREASTLAGLAKILGTERDLNEAICAAESAFALDPQQEYCVLLALLQYDLVRQHLSRFRTAASIDLDERRQAQQAALHAALLAARRCHELDLWRLQRPLKHRARYASMGVNGNPFEPYVPRNYPNNPDQEPPMAAEPAEMLQLREEYEAVCRQKMRILIDLANGEPEDLGYLAAHELRQIDYFAKDGADFAAKTVAILARIDRCLDELNSRSHARDKSAARFLRAEKMKQLGDQLRWTYSTGGSTKPIHSRWSAAEVLPLWQALFEHSDPQVSAYGCRALYQLEDHRDQAVRRALELLPQGYGPDLCGYIRDHLGGTSELEQVLEDIVSQAEKAADPGLLAERTWVVFALLDTIEKDDRNWLSRITELAARAVPANSQGAAFVPAFKTALADYKRRHAPTPATPGGIELRGAWEEYTVTKVQPPRLGASGQVICVIPVAPGTPGTESSDMFALYLGKWNTLDIGLLTPTGGKAVRQLGKCSRDYRTQPLPLAAASRTHLFIATGKLGLACLNLDTQEVEEFEPQDGYLGTAKVSSMACAGGKLYYLSDAFCEFDPATRKFRLLASPAASEKRGPFDGRESYSISSLLADEQHDCVWFSSSANGLKGIWKYTPATNQFELVFDAANSTRISSPIWNEGSIIFFAFMQLPSQDYRQRVQKLLAALNLTMHDYAKLTPEQRYGLSFDRQLLQLNPASGAVKELADYGNLELSDTRFLLIGDHVVRSNGILFTPGGHPHDLHLDNNWDSIFPTTNGFVAFRLSPEDEHLLLFQRKSPTK